LLDQLRRKLREAGPVGFGVAAAAVLVGVVVLGYSARNHLGPSEAARLSSDRVYICSQTGKTFRYSDKVANKYPVRSPHSGTDTGYPAQFCFWTRDGQFKAEPSYVLHNSFIGKPGPTFCPECDRLVRLDAGPVTANSVAPPTRDEYMKRRPGKGEQPVEENQ
jgi:hypothetical protein